MEGALEAAVFAGSALGVLGLGVLLGCLSCLRIARTLGLGGARGKGARWQGVAGSEFADLDDEDLDDADVGGPLPGLMRLQVHLHPEGEKRANDFEVVDLETSGIRTIGDVKEAVAESYADAAGLSHDALMSRMVVQVRTLRRAL